MFRNLDAEQKRHGMTNQDVAEYLGVSRNSYEIKKTNGKFKLEEIQKLIGRFGCDFGYLFATEEPTEKDTA